MVDLVPLQLRKFLSLILSVKTVKCYKVTHVSIQNKTNKNKQTNKQTNKTKCMYSLI